MLFDKQTIQRMRIEMDDALGEISKKYDINFTIGKINYQIDKFTAQIECFIGNKEASEQREFDIYAQAYGFQKSDYKTRFIYDGKTYEFVGFSPSARKYRYICRNVLDGSITRFSNVRRYLENYRVAN